jgi:hypothetical protein
LLRIIVFSLLLTLTAAAQQKVNLQTQVKGVLPVANGGTGTTVGGVSSPFLWNRVGTVLWPRLDLAVDQQAAQEVSVMYDTSGNCFLLAGSPSACWRMIFHCGWTVNNVCYAEAPDPYGNWQRQSGALTGITPNVYATDLWFKAGSTYYFFAQSAGALDRWTSPNGFNGWVGPDTGVIPKGSAGSWNAISENNPSIETNGPVVGTWYALIEGIGTGCPQSCIGSATSTDNGLTWTFSPLNPLTNLVGFGGPDLHYLNGQWYAYLHTGTLPSDIWLTTSLDFANWTVPVPAIQRQTIDEGGATIFFTTAQIADPFVMEAPCFAFTRNHNSPTLIASSNKCSYMFMEAMQTQTIPTDSHIKMAVANMPLAQAIAAVQTSSPEPGISAIQGGSDYQAGHIFGVAPFYWMTRTSGNTDSFIKLSYTATTTASYSFGGIYTQAPACTISPVIPGATTFAITTLSTNTLTVTANGVFTGTVNAICGGFN